LKVLRSLEGQPQYIGQGIGQGIGS
jgi:hypothetical protein